MLEHTLCGGVAVAAPRPPSLAVIWFWYGANSDPPPSLVFQVEMVALENGVAMGRIWYPLGDEGATGNYSCLSSGPIGSNSGSSSSSASDGGGLGDYGSSSFFTFAVEWTDDRFR